MTRSLIAFIFILLHIPYSYAYKNAWHHRKNSSIKNIFITGPIKDGPITIFIHGTKESLASRFVHAVDYPCGIVAATLQGKHSVLARLAYALEEGCPKQFAIDSIYLYCWAGKLNFKSRTNAASDLYHVLKYHKGPKTIIAHSHGCNVALNLAQAAKLNKDTMFVIERLILMACPVQKVNACQILSPIFKRVYTFYSTGDIFQIADPQGIYLDSRFLRRSFNIAVPFFSERTFPPAPNLIQTRILLDKKSPGHLQFLLRRFLRKLPATLALLDNAHQVRKGNHFIVNIPRFNGKPHFIKPSELRYIPRAV